MPVIPSKLTQIPPSFAVAPNARQSGGRGEERWAGYNAFILAFSLIAIGMLVIGVAVELGPSTRSILAYADFAVCLVFLFDFVVTLVRAEDKLRYLLTWGWLDLVSSIPVFDTVRWGRAARVVRILRVVRGIKATRLLASMIFQQRALNAVMAGAFVAILVIFASSFAILHFEDIDSGTIRSPEDALWWAICTITTVGYGDLYPVTWEGRVVAFFLMVTGASTFGTLAGLLASWFMESQESADRAELRRVTEELAAVRLLLEEQARTGPTVVSGPLREPPRAGPDGYEGRPRSRVAA